jgi:hypothetical protein
MSGVWELNDPIAEKRDGRWRIGSVAAVDKWTVTIRWDGAEHLVYRSPSDTALVDPDTVPIDERHWLPATVRDQLVRVEVADRLRAVAAALPPTYLPATGLVGLAVDLDNLLDPSPGLAAAARLLLTRTAPQPAATP